MIVARRKRDENIVEYLIYMWQVEDLIRANQFDMSLIEERIISQYSCDDNLRAEIREWWDNLCAMMTLEKVENSGHLQVNMNTLNEINYLHNILLKEPNEVAYRHIFNATMPFIREFDTKSGKMLSNDIEVCVTAIYSTYLLKLQKKEVSESTMDALKVFSRFLALLAAKYKEDQEGKLKIE